MTELGERATGGDLSKFNYFFKWNRIFLKIVGIWPLKNEEVSKFQNLCSYVLTFVLAIIVASAWADLITIWGQFDPMIDNMSASLATSLSLIKIIIMRWNFEILNRCVGEVRKDWCCDHTSEDLETMQRRAKIGRLFSMASPGLAIGTAVFFSILPLTVESTNEGSEISASFPLRASYFFDPTPTPVYQLIYLAQTAACHTSSISFAATDSLFAALVLHACGQLEILGRKFRAVDNKRPIIEILVDRHLKLIKFVAELEHVYSSIIFGQLLISSLSICGIGYKFITEELHGRASFGVPYYALNQQCSMLCVKMSNELSVNDMNQSDRILLENCKTIIFLQSLADGNFVELGKFSFFLIAMLIQIFVYCYAGQCLIDESTRLSEAAYDCPWYEMNQSNAKAFLFIQSKTQKPLQLASMSYFVMSHSCFADILSRSVTYLSVLRAVKATI